MGKKRKQKSNEINTEEKQTESQKRPWLTPTNKAMLSIGIAGFAIAARSMFQQGSEEIAPPFSPPTLPEKGVDYFEYASSLPQEECTQLVSGITSPSNFGSDFMDELIDYATQGNEKTASKLKESINSQKDRLTDESKSMVSICLASSPKISIPDDRRVERSGSEGRYSHTTHEIQLSKDYQNETFIHEAEHCAQSEMSSIYTDTASTKKALASPYPTDKATKKESREDFESSVIKFMGMLHKTATEIKSGKISQSSEEMINAFEEAFPAEEPHRGKGRIILLPKSINAKDPRIASAASSDYGKKAAFKSDQIIRDINSDYYGKENKKHAQYYLSYVDEKQNGLVFKPLDKETRFLDTFQTLNERINESYSVDSLKRRLPHYSVDQLIDVRDSEAYTNAIQFFGHPKFMEKYAPEMLEFSSKTQKSFAQRVCSQGFASKEGQQSSRGMA